MLSSSITSVINSELLSAFVDYRRKQGTTWAREDLGLDFINYAQRNSINILLIKVLIEIIGRKDYQMLRKLNFLAHPNGIAILNLTH